MSIAYYQSQMDLTGKLRLDWSPGVIIYSHHNEKWINSLKGKFGEQYQWYQLEDECWID